MHVDCGDGAWTAARLDIGLPVLCLYALPFPLAIVLLLWRRRNALEKTRTRQLFRVPFREFKPDRACAWEAAVSMRKLLLGMVPVLLETEGPWAQSVGGLVIITVALAMHAWVKPCVCGSVNRLELLAMLAACATLALAIAIQATELGLVKRGGGDGRVAFPVLIAALNALVALEALRTAVFRHVRVPVPAWLGSESKVERNGAVQDRKVLRTDGVRRLRSADDDGAGTGGGFASGRAEEPATEGVEKPDTGRVKSL